MPSFLPRLSAMLAVLMPTTLLPASNIGDVRLADQSTLSLQWEDSRIEYGDTGTGPTAHMGHEVSGPDTFLVHGRGLNTQEATKVVNYRIQSQDDPRFSQPQHPRQVFRKSKVNGADATFPEPHHGLTHTLYLELPLALEEGASYTLEIDAPVGGEATTRAFVFDSSKTVSEALHVNLVGYNPRHTVMKSADLYLWRGEGGARDYKPFEGRDVYLIEEGSGRRIQAGKVSFWRKSGKDYGGRNLTASDVWNCDFSEVTESGRFRLHIPGIGCSLPFTLDSSIYLEPYRTSLRGFFYMRIGMAVDSAYPPPRQPRFIQDQDPSGFKVYLSTMHPWHPDWRKGGTDPWDWTDWSAYTLPGQPTNPQAWGGHSDACDWDRHIGHVSIIWDMLLPILLTNGGLLEDNLGIPESGNGIPDLIDEACYETDFWLRLRDPQGGFSCGLNNPNRKTHTHLYQAAAQPIAAWCSAANAAMTAMALQLSGQPKLAASYVSAAKEAWMIAADGDLDRLLDIGDGRVRGRDLKMLAAACLYGVTGERHYEDIVRSESLALLPDTQIDKRGSHCQYWSTAAYLMCARYGWQPIHYRELVEAMRDRVVNEAAQKNLVNSETWPSRRPTDNAYGHFQTTPAVHAVLIAHAATTDGRMKARLLKALILEGDYSQGRNPLNLVHMTGLTPHAVDHIYTSGRNDGIPGVHPGHTPYMNSEPWGEGFMADPRWYANRGYPSWEQWPHGEAFWPVRYCYSNNEFTPQQTMRGKMAMLAYLYALRNEE